MTSFARRRALNSVGTALAMLCLALAVVPLVAMLFHVLQQGGSHLGLSFFTDLPPEIGLSGGGMSNAILGTLELIPIASAIGMPIGLLSGIYLSRAGNGKFANSVRFVTDVIAGTPSVVAGVVAYALVVTPFGFSAIAGGVALGLLMFPTITRATEEAIKLVPGTVREAALALGLPEWKTMFRVVLPAAINGIVTAMMLGIARVTGETAPLVFTVLGSNQNPGSPLKPIQALPLQIWTFATSPAEAQHQLAWTGAFVLFAIVVVLNLTARLLTYRLSSRVGSGA